MGEPFGLIAKFVVDDAYYESEDTYDVMHNLVETPLEVSCDMHVQEESSSLSCDNVLHNPLDQSHVSPMCSQYLLSPESYFDVSIDNFCDM